MQMQNINITYSSLIRVIIVVLAVAFLYVIRDIVLVLFLSIILSAALDPWVSWFERRHLPRSVGMLAIYIVLFAAISVGVLIIPAVTTQAEVLGTNLPSYYERIVDTWSKHLPFIGDPAARNVETVARTMGMWVGNVLPAIRGIFGGGFTFFLILVLTFYLSCQDRGLKRFFRSIMPVNYQPYFTRMTNRVQQKMGMWLRGQLLLSVVIFLVTAVSLFIFNSITHAAPYWLVLAFIAGILEAVPFLGPFIAGTIAAVLTLANSFWAAIAVVLIYIIIQQLENNILVPRIMHRAVGLNPIVVILVVVIGGRLAGVLGSLIAIPVAAALQVFLKDVLVKEKEKEKELALPVPEAGA